MDLGQAETQPSPEPIAKGDIDPADISASKKAAEALFSAPSSVSASSQNGQPPSSFDERALISAPSQSADSKADNATSVSKKRKRADETTGHDQGEGGEADTSLETEVSGATSNLVVDDHEEWKGMQSSQVGGEEETQERGKQPSSIFAFAASQLGFQMTQV